MVAFSFNAFQHDPSGGTVVIDAGKYPAIITDTKIKPTKAGTGQILVVTFRIAQGPNAGRTLDENYNVANPNQQAVDIAMGQLAAIGMACGVPQIQDTAQWHGRPLIIDVIKEARADGKGDANAVVGYFDVNGVAPTKAPQQAQAQPQQQTPPPAQNPAQQPGQAPWGGGAPAGAPTGPAPWGDQQAQPQQQAPWGGAQPQPGADAPPPWAQQ